MNETMLGILIVILLIVIYYLLCKISQYKTDMKYFRDGWESCAKQEEKISRELHDLQEYRNQIREGMKELLRK